MIICWCAAWPPIYLSSWIEFSISIWPAKAVDGPDWKYENIAHCKQAANCIDNELASKLAVHWNVATWKSLNHEPQTFCAQVKLVRFARSFGVYLAIILSA